MNVIRTATEPMSLCFYYALECGIIETSEGNKMCHLCHLHFFIFVISVEHMEKLKSPLGSYLLMEGLAYQMNYCDRWKRVYEVSILPLAYTVVGLWFWVQWLFETIFQFILTHLPERGYVGLVLYRCTYVSSTFFLPLVTSYIY